MQKFIRIAAVLFSLQVFHLYWMTTHVVALRLIGRSLFAFPTEFSWLYVLVDYTEIPVTIGTVKKAMTREY